MILIKENQIDTRMPDGDMSGIKLRDVNWAVKTAGPSPYDNQRTELFLLGCNKAMTGNPCEGCFNKSTWDVNMAQWSHDPIKMAEHINNNAPNKYITIGGGEPTDQIDNLIILCEELKKYDFHIMMYTWRRLSRMVSKPSTFNIGTNLDGYSASDYLQNEYIGMRKIVELLKHVDIIVDGEYNQMETVWDGTREDGLLSSVGSGNQIIWDINKKRGFAMRDILQLGIDEYNNLIYKVNANTVNKEIKLNY